MAHKTLVNGTVYKVSGGRTLVNGTGYSIKGGNTRINGTGYHISFGFTVTLKVGTQYNTNETYGTTNGRNCYIHYSIDGGITWVDVPPANKTKGATLLTLEEVSTIMFKGFIESGRNSKAAVGTTTDNYNIVSATYGAGEAISDEITLTGDTTYHLSLWNHGSVW